MESYYEIPPATLPIDKPSPCKTTGNVTPQSARLESGETQVSWLKEVVQLLQKEQLNQDEIFHGQLTLHIFNVLFAIHLRFLL